jgi:hypothetical protein
VRRSTRSLVIGTAKVIEWEDLERARSERAAKDKAAAVKGKGKRGRKRKVPALFSKSSDELGDCYLPRNGNHARAVRIGETSLGNTPL